MNEVSTMATPTITEDPSLWTTDHRGDEVGFGALRCDRGLLPLEAMDVRAAVTGLVARVEVAQTYVNHHPVAIEATYIFPLPERAAVSAFVLEVAGRLVRGELKERGEARQDYEAALAAGQRAALAEEDRSGVFTMSVGNILPGESARVRLTMTQPLDCREGEATFRFPLVVAPRYIPGAPLDGASVGDGTEADTDAVPDASRISPPVRLPGFPAAVRLSVEVELDGGGLSIARVRSSLHTVVVESDGTRWRLRLQPGERLDRDFILRWQVGREAVQTGLVLCPDSDGAREGTFMLTVVPPILPAGARRGRDIVFVLDRSGSMDGWKMVAARRAVASMVETLGESDRFAVYAFDDRIETAFGDHDLRPGINRYRFEAAQLLAGIKAWGGTEMAEPLRLAAERVDLGVADRSPMVVLVTDGQVGNEAQIIKTLGPRLKHVRVFTVGIDRSVNIGFLQKLAELGGGAFELVEGEARLEEVMERIHRAIGEPELTKLSIEGHGPAIDAATLVPRRIPDLHAGASLTLCGRYTGAHYGEVAVKGLASTGSQWVERVEGVVRHDPAVREVWARGQVRALEDAFDAGQLALDGHARIVETSLRFGVLSRFTAFVAVDEEVVTEGVPQHSVLQPVENPSGWGVGGAASTGSMAAVNRPAAMAAAPGTSTLTGGAGAPMLRSTTFAQSMPSMAGAPLASPSTFPVKRRRSAWVGWLVALIVLALLGGLGWWLVSWLLAA